MHTDLTISNDGVDLAMSVCGDATGIPLLFLHGFTMSRDTWNETIASLGDRFQSWTLDLRGHGHSGRATSYETADFIADALAAIDAIGRPVVLVGHSLGASIAGSIAQRDNPLVRGAFLEDPPWYLGVPEEYERSIFPRLFSVLHELQSNLRSADAPLRSYAEFLANAPSLAGGKTSDHVSERHILSHASALQRLDPQAWDALGGILAGLTPDRPILKPCRLIQADPALGPAFLDGHERRLEMSNPAVQVMRYDGSGHSPHRALAFEARFAQDLNQFIDELPPG
ncbi:MAG: alpha/beta hydrolase [Burkholderiaceae bacterium]